MKCAILARTSIPRPPSSATGTERALQHGMRQRRRCLLATVSLVAALASAACGNRHSHAEVVAAAQVGPPVVTTAGVATSAAPDGTAVTTAPAGGVSSAPVTTSSTAASGGGGSTAPAISGGGSSTAVTAAPAPGGPTAKPTTARSGAASSAASGPQDTTPIVLCQDGSFTGQAGPPFSGGQPGLAAWVSWTNAHGGLAGHPVKVDSKDDAQDNNKALQNVQTCVQNEKAVALIASFMPVTVDAVGSYVQQHKIAVIGGDAVTRLWFQNPYFFPQGDPSPSDAYGGVQAWKDAGKTSGAVIYCAELGDCTNTANRVREAAAKAGIPMKGSYQVSIANPSYTSQCSDMKSHGVQAVYINVDGPSIQRVARDCNAVGFHPLLTSGGLALDANAVADDANLEGFTVATAVFPWMTSATQGAKDFQTAMATYAPDVTPSESAAVAWTSGAILADAIAKLGNAARTQPITSTLILQGLTMIKNDTIGGLAVGPLTFVAGKPAAEHFCWGLAQLTGGKWSAPAGNATKCAT